MDLKNMKMTPKEAKEQYEPKSLDSPQYPYGLCLNLDNDSLEKLGIPIPAVGQELSLTAKVEVTSVSQYDSKNGHKNSSISLQITDMALEKSKQKVDSKKIYDNSGE